MFKSAALALGLAAFALSSSFARAEGPEIGKPAPEINAKTWLNQLGAEPNLASLRGTAVLIEFWATT